MTVMSDEMQAMQLRIPKVLLADARQVAASYGISQAEALRMGLAQGLVKLRGRPTPSERADEQDKPEEGT